MLGIDMIGMVESKASNDNRFILVVIYYFTKINFSESKDKAYRDKESKVKVKDIEAKDS